MLDVLILLAFSVLTWCIIVYKSIFYRRVYRNNRVFLEKFRSGMTREEVNYDCEQVPLGKVIWISLVVKSNRAREDMEMTSCAMLHKILKARYGVQLW